MLIRYNGWRKLLGTFNLDQFFDTDHRFSILSVGLFYAFNRTRLSPDDHILIVLQLIGTLSQEPICPFLHLVLNEIATQLIPFFHMHCFYCLDIILLFIGKFIEITNSFFLWRRIDEIYFDWSISVYFGLIPENIVVSIRKRRQTDLSPEIFVMFAIFAGHHMASFKISGPWHGGRFIWNEITNWRNRITQLCHNIFSWLNREIFVVISFLLRRWIFVIWAGVHGNSRSGISRIFRRRCKSVDQIFLNFVVVLVCLLTLLRLPVQIGCNIGLVFQSIFKIFERWFYLVSQTIFENDIRTFVEAIVLWSESATIL